MIRRQNGVTLIELLVTLSIMVLVLVPAVTLVSMYMGTHHEVMEDNQLQHEARLILEHIHRVVHEADQASDLLWENGYLILNGEVVLWHDEIAGREYGNRLLRGEAGAYILSSNVHEDTFIALNNRTLEIYLVLAQPANSRYELRTKIAIRNKKE